MQGNFLNCRELTVSKVCSRRRSVNYARTLSVRNGEPWEHIDGGYCAAKKHRMVRWSYILGQVGG